MKIEVDLGDVFCEEDGNPAESIQASVQRQVVTILTKKIGEGISKQIDAEVSRVISEVLQRKAEELLPALAADMLNAEYRTVGQFGRMGELTTFREQLLKTITEQMVYKKAKYDSDKNTYSKAVDDVITENLKAFQSDFTKLVTDKFREETLAYAVNSLKKKLGLDK